MCWQKIVGLVMVWIPAVIVAVFMVAAIFYIVKEFIRDFSLGGVKEFFINTNWKRAMYDGLLVLGIVAYFVLSHWLSHSFC